METTHSKRTFYFITSIFFAWGFITCLNDILAPALKDKFVLTYTETMLIQFCFFATYAIMSLPMSTLLARAGYRLCIFIGLLIAALGCVIFWSAAHLGYYPLFLFGMFVLASGIVALQVAANPYVTLLGSKSGASSRLTLAQAVNSLGYTIAPFILGGLIIQGSVTTAYIGLAVALILMGIIVYKYHLPEFAQQDNVQHETKENLWHSPIAILGAIAIFTYVGAEVSAGTLLVNYLNLTQVANMPKADATHYLSVFWGGALVGRFIGSWLLNKFKPALLVAFNAIVNILLLVFSMLIDGKISMWTMLSLGLFNSIMFPTIFAITVSSLEHIRKQVSGLLCAAIVGGAVIPELQGILADVIGLRDSYIILIFCYGFILFYMLYFYFLYNKQQQQI